MATTERQLFEETLRRERLVVEDPQQTGLVCEQYPTDGPVGEQSEDGSLAANGVDEKEPSDGGLLGNLVRKALQ